jgi:hypothetical protein
LLTFSVKDEKSGEEIEMCIDRDVPLAVVHRNLVRSGVSISGDKLKALIEQAQAMAAAADDSVH